MAHGERQRVRDGVIEEGRRWDGVCLFCHDFQAKISGRSHGHCLCKVGAFDASDATPAGEKARKD